MADKVIKLFPIDSSGYYWNSSMSGGESDYKAAGKLVYDNGGRVQRISFDKESVLNEFGCSTIESFKNKIKIKKVDLCIYYYEDRKNYYTSTNPTLKINLDNSSSKNYDTSKLKTFSSDYWDDGIILRGDSQIEPIEAKKIKSYEMTNLFINKFEDMNSTFYLWTTFKNDKTGVDGTFCGTMLKDGNNRIHLEITYQEELFSPVITRCVVTDKDFYKEEGVKQVPVEVNFVVPPKEGWPEEYRNWIEAGNKEDYSFFLISDISNATSFNRTDYLELSPLPNGTYSINQNVKVFNDGNRIDLKISVGIKLRYEKEGVQNEIEAVSAPYLYRFVSAPIPLSLSCRGRGVSIGYYTSLDRSNDVAGNERFECHYPIIIFNNNKEITPMYGSELPTQNTDENGNSFSNIINGQLFFKIPDTASSGWVKLEPYIYLE